MRRLSDRQAPVACCVAGWFALLTVLASCAGNWASTELLFAPDEVRLDRKQQQRVVDAFAKLFPLSADGDGFTDPNCGNVDPEAMPVDLNGDDVFEVFIQWGNSCTSGGSGRSLSLFVSDANGTYVPQLGFPALGWSLLRIEQQEWPNLSFGGPGFCHPVWTWQEGVYVFKCSLPEEPGVGGDCDRVCAEM